MIDRCRSVVKLRWIWLLSLLSVCAWESGCVERRMTIRSNPPGAVVYVDDYEIGTTPVSTDFTYYGTRKIRLVKNGYETLTVMQPVSVPWYQYVPIDFVAENLVPGNIRDNRTFDYQLVPQAVVPTEQLLDRAEVLRRQTRVSGVVQAGPSGAGRQLPGAVAPATGLAPVTVPAGTVPPTTVPPASSPGYPAPPGTTWPGEPASTAPPATAPGSQTPYPTVPPGGWPTGGS